MNERSAEHRLRYAKQFASVLANKNASPLLQITPDKRIHAMKALSNLSKFTGQYDTFLQLRQKFNLKWSTGTEKIDAFTRLFDDARTLDKMLMSLKESIKVLPKNYANFFLFCTLTGLRIVESINCIRLVNDPSKFQEYYNSNNFTLEHFRYPAIFIRRTKAAYITIIDKQILQIAQDIEKTPTYNSLKMLSRRRCLSMQMKYTRKIFASYLRKMGIQYELLDLLQGRVPKSVFVRHYFTPSADYRDKALQAVHQLQREIEE